jgi:hypothetical protein
MTRGEGKSNLIFNHHSDRPVYVLYMDHIIYLNSNPILYREPNKRETVGWIVKETEEAIWINWDRSLKSLSYQRLSLEYSGLVILKSTVLAIEKLDLPLPIRYHTEKSTKTKGKNNADR